MSHMSISSFVIIDAVVLLLVPAEFLCWDVFDVSGISSSAVDVVAADSERFRSN